MLSNGSTLTAYTAGKGKAKDAAPEEKKKNEIQTTVGLCTLNQVDP